MKISLILADNKFLASAYKTIFFCVIKSLRVRKLLHHPTKNIVILNFHRLGDSVFTLPSLKEILKYFNTNIYLFCFEETKPIFESIFEKESVITFFKFDFHFNNRIAGNAVRKKLKQINPEKVIDLTGSTLSASVLITSTARDIIGLNEEYYKSIYTKFTPLRTRPHIMDIYLDVIRMIIPDIDNSIKEFNSTINKGGYLLVHPFAGWTAK
jgi:ADP-heptose:LPS heptosyltransferase